MEPFNRFLIRAYALIALCAFGNSALATASLGNYAVPASDKRIALLIGVENYNPSTQWSALQYAVDDVSVIGETLEQLGYNTQYLRHGPDSETQYSDSINKQEIIYRLKQLAVIEPEPELFLLVFSGHGFSLDNDNYLALPDTPSVAPRKSNPSGLLSVKELETLVRVIVRPRKLVMFFDACRNENRSDKGANVVASFIAKAEGDWRLYSTSQDSSSWELSKAEFSQQNRNRLVDGRPGHGAFSYKLIQGLRGEADMAASGNHDGLVTFKELSQYVIKEVPPLVSLAKQSLQIPYKSVEHGADLGLAGYDILTRLSLDFSTIPAGSFKMGSNYGDTNEKPVHLVEMPSFKMMKYEVTKDQFMQFIEATGYRTDAQKNVGQDGCYVWKDSKGRYRANASWKSPLFNQTSNHPVVCVSYNDAFAFADWISRQTGKHYRLPSEAEWEYAARAGTTTDFAFGEQITTDQANFNGTESYNRSRKGVYREKTVAVDSFQPNAWGLYNMHGNVWEWTEDCWNDSHQGYNNNHARREGDCTSRALRGGSWYEAPSWLRSAFRYKSGNAHRSGNLGFRLVQDH